MQVDGCCAYRLCVCDLDHKVPDVVQRLEPRLGAAHRGATACHEESNPGTDEADRCLQTRPGISTLSPRGAEMANRASARRKTRVSPATAHDPRRLTVHLIKRPLAPLAMLTDALYRLVLVVPLSPTASHRLPASNSTTPTDQIDLSAPHRPNPAPAPRQPRQRALRIRSSPAWRPSVRAQSPLSCRPINHHHEPSPHTPHQPKPLLPFPFRYSPPPPRVGFERPGLT